MRKNNKQAIGDIAPWNFISNVNRLHPEIDSLSISSFEEVFTVPFR